MTKRLGRCLIIGLASGIALLIAIVVVLWTMSHLAPLGYYWEGPVPVQVSGAYDQRAVWSTNGRVGFGYEYTGYPILMNTLKGSGWLDGPGVDAYGLAYLQQNASLNRTSYQLAGIELLHSSNHALVIVVPHWMLLALALLAGSPLWLTWWRLRRRAAGGHCGKCGYDLRASAGPCPECGAS